MRAVLLAVALAALTAAPASAATITYDGGTVVYRAQPGEALYLSVGFAAGCSGAYDCVTFYGNAVSWTPAGNCQAQADNTVWCVVGDGVQIIGGAGDDDVSLLEADIGGFPAGAGYALALDGGAGNDRLDGGSGPETIHGGPGADLLAGRGGGDALYGDDGNDTLRGDGAANGNSGTGGGDDRLYGGAGDDVLTGDTPDGSAAVGHDVLDGGPGTDTVTGDWYRFDGNGNDADPPPTVTFDGAANDGRPGEGDDVVGVERIESSIPAGPVPTTFVGDDGPNTFMLLFTNGAVSGGGGNDTIAGSDYADALDGGAGDDRISGGFGDDAITGGPGRDDLGGDRTAACEYGPIFGTCTIGTGNDTIYAQDGEPDAIDCGPGADTAYVDAVDTAVGCETVRTAPGPAPPVAPPAAPPTAPGRSSLPAATVTVSRQRLATVARRRALAVSCRLPRAGRCTVRAVAKLHGRRTTLGRAHATFRKAGRRTLRVRLSRTTARALRRLHSLRVTLTVTATYADGRRTTTKRVRL